MKYPTLAALKDAYDKGELSRETDKLYLDNDDASLYVGDSGSAAFEIHPNDLLTEALALLGIPWDLV